MSPSSIYQYYYSTSRGIKLSPEDRRKWERLLDSVETHVRGIPHARRSSPNTPSRVAREEKFKNLTEQRTASVYASIFTIPEPHKKRERLILNTADLNTQPDREEQQFNLPSLTDIEELITIPKD